MLQEAGYNAAFLTLAVIAGVAFVLLWLAVPETLRRVGNDVNVLDREAPFTAPP